LSIEEHHERTNTASVGLTPINQGAHHSAPSLLQAKGASVNVASVNVVRTRTTAEASVQEIRRRGPLAKTTHHDGGTPIEEIRKAVRQLPVGKFTAQ
jgi:hypothetical protein